MSEPLPHRIGAYRIDGVLGRGGMGVVYRAVDATGAPVALKTVGVARPALVDGIRREARALARLAHPGVVRVLAEGMHDDLPWYAMELVDGRPLSGLWAARPDEHATSDATRAVPHADATTRTLPAEDAVDGAPGDRDDARPLDADGLRDVLGAFARLAATLSFVHGEGVTHRDLKPGNVLLRGNGEVVLVDFGLVAPFPAGVGREVLEFADDAGTFAYMAPEQIQGALADARSDLYALGCMLYEALTGAPPFRGSPSAVVRGHLSMAPRPPSSLVPGLPPALDALCLGLLAKEPADRIAHGSVVARVLSEVAGHDLVPTDWPAPRPYLFRGGLVGRTTELRGLLRRVEQVERGRGAAVWVTGESGLGKTRLALELGRAAHRDGFRLLSGVAAPVAGDALHPLRDPITTLVDVCREGGIDVSERVFGERGPWLAPFFPAIADLPGQAAHAAPPSGPDARARLVEAVGDTLVAAAAEQPLALVLDDLQWADPLTVDVLALLAGGRIEAARLLVVGTWRAEESSEPLRRLAGLPHASLVELSRLDARGVAQLAADLLAQPDVPAALVASIAEQSEGNPFFVTELLRGAVNEARITRDAAGRWVARAGLDTAGLDLPGTLVELVERRLSGLPDDAAAVARAVAIFGREASPDALRAIAGLDDRRFYEAAAELVARQVLSEEPGTLRFAHDKVREAAYRRVPEGERPGWHRAAADALQALPGGDAPALSATLGFHREHAGQAEEAAGHYHSAAKLALSRYDHAEAERRLVDAIRLAPPSRARLEARYDLSFRILRMQGRYEEAQVAARAEADEAQALGDGRAQSRALRTLAGSAFEVGRFDVAEPGYRHALAIAEECGDVVGIGLGHNNLGILAHARGRLLDAETHLEAAAAAFERGGAPDRQVGVHAALAVVKAERGAWPDALQLYRRTLSFARRLGDENLEAVVLANLANLLTGLGELGEARTLYDHALVLHERMRNRRMAAFVVLNLGVLALAEGDFAEAHRWLDRALEELRVVDRATLVVALAQRATVLEQEGRLDEAAVALADITGRLEGLGLGGPLAGARVTWARVRRRQGDLEAASGLLEAASGALEGSIDLEGHVALDVERGHLALARGDAVGAVEALGRAEARVAPLGCGPRAPLARSVAGLRAAVASHA